MRVQRSDFIRVVATLLYAGGYHFAYATYLNPIFEYAYYRLANRTWPEWIFTYLLALLPALWQRGSGAVYAGVSLIYLLLYVPALITMCAMWEGSFASYALVALSLFIGQFIIQTAIPVRTAWSAGSQLLFRARVRNTVFALAVVSAVVFIFENRAHMQFVDFQDVYDLRFASRDSGSVLSGYLSMWLLGVCIPYFLALAVTSRSLVWGLFAVGCSVVLYMGNGAKSALLMPVQGLIVGWIASRNKNTTAALAGWLAPCVCLLALIESEWLGIPKSLVLMRLLSTGGWTMTTYYEFFSTHGFTHYTSVGPVGALFGRAYDREPGQLIGWEYFSSDDANFNANFWATDGIAALGVPGVILASLLMALVLRAFFDASKGLEQRGAAILFAGLWLSVLNGSIFTSMLSGGGFLLLALIWFAKMGIRKRGASATTLGEARAVRL